MLFFVVPQRDLFLYIRWTLFATARKTAPHRTEFQLMLCDEGTPIRTNHRTARINRIIKDVPCDFSRAPRAHTHQINVDTCEKPPKNCVHRLAQSHVADGTAFNIVRATTVAMAELMLKPCAAAAAAAAAAYARLFVCACTDCIRLCVCIGPSWCCNVYIFYLSRTTNPLSFSAHNVQHYTHTPSAPKSLEAFLLFGFLHTACNAYYA